MKPPSSLDPAELALEQLKKLLKKQADQRPKYLYTAVTNVPGVREYRYVFWLDLMGARSAMKLSLPRAARSIMKIHVAALAAIKDYPSVEINPVMDGVYGYAKDRASLEDCLKSILTALAQVFILERFASNRFMVRAGVSYGPLLPGETLAVGSDILTKNVGYLGGTAIGMAISHAYEAEGNAPPFGVYIHESARAFAPTGKDGAPYTTNLWHWCDEDEDGALLWGLRRTLVQHFDWVNRNPVGSQYDAAAAQRHKALADEYFELHLVQSTQ